jgi:hypothetical protein
MDYGRAAAKKERPKRSIIVLVSMMLAFVGSCGYRIIEQKYRKNIIAWYNQVKQ